MNQKKQLKKGIGHAVILCGLILCMSCADQQEKNETAVDASDPVLNLYEDNLDAEPLTAEELADPTAQSWEDFKVAVQSKDEAQLANFCTPEITDYQGLIFMLNELFVMKKMEATAFDDLEEVEIDDVSYFQFYAEDVGIDEFGYEYGTSVTLNFIVVEQFLFLSNYSAAG